MRLVILTLGWIVGILCAASFAALIPLAWILLIGITAFTAYLGFHTKWRWLLLTIFAIAAGGWRYQLLPQTSSLAQYHDTGSATIIGIVVEEPDRRDHLTLLKVSAESIEIGGDPIPTAGLALVEAAALSQVRYGDRIRVTGTINEPQVFDTFSYADYLARESVFTLMRQTHIDILSSGHGMPLFAALIDLREQLVRRISTSLPEPQAGLLSGILLGQERMIAPEIEEAFASTGTAHIIAISGFNMAVIAGILMATLGKILPGRRAGFTAIFVLLLYTVFVGANAAVIRAAIMSSMVIIGSLLRRRSYMPASVAFTALILSAIDPAILWDVSFQLSLAAVMGITSLTASINRAYDRLLPRHPLTDLLREPIVVTIAAMLATMPIIALYFQRVSLITVLVNVLVIPVQPIILFLGGAATIITFILPPAGHILYWLTLIPLSWTTDVIRLFAQFPFAELNVSIPAPFVFSLYLIFIGGIMIAARPYWLERLTQRIQRRSSITAIFLTGLAICTLLMAIFLSRPDGLLHIWWLNVGHSNAVLIQTPGGAQILIDGGRYPSRLLTSIGDRIPFHDRTIEMLIISQPDELDVNALPAVLERYQTGVVLSNGQPGLSESVTALDRALQTTNRLIVQAGYTVETSDGVVIEVLSPDKQPQLGDSLNDHSIVLRIRYGEAVFLFPGDLSRSAQDKLVESGLDLQATVLHVPQHGTTASLSEGFLEAVQPQVTVIQADPANRSGDPDLDILSMLGETQLFRTDQNGALHMWTDGSALWVLPEK
jgi:competence protein ComEC